MRVRVRRVTRSIIFPPGLKKIKTPLTQPIPSSQTPARVSRIQTIHDSSNKRLYFSKAKTNNTQGTRYIKIHNNTVFNFSYFIYHNLSCIHPMFQSDCSRMVVPKLCCASKSPGRLIKNKFLSSSPRVFCTLGLESGLRIFISHQFLGDVDAASLGTNSWRTTGLELPSLSTDFFFLLISVPLYSQSPIWKASNIFSPRHDNRVLGYNSGS